MCQVEHDQVIAVHDVTTTYHVPLLLEQQNFTNTITKILDLQAIPKPPELVQKGGLMWKDWVKLAKDQDHNLESVSIALVGKYTSLHDAYISVCKALEHSAMHCRKNLNLVWVDASDLEDETLNTEPANFHKAWHAVCTAKGVCLDL